MAHRHNANFRSSKVDFSDGDGGLDIDRERRHEAAAPESMDAAMNVVATAIMTNTRLKHDESLANAIRDDTDIRRRVERSGSCTQLTRSS